MHPVTLVFKHLIEPALGSYIEAPTALSPDCKCGYCGRRAVEFDFEGYLAKDGYKKPITLCKPCYSFNIGIHEVMGAESHNKITGKPKAHKFGMAPGWGWVFCLETQQSHLLCPPGSFIKIPEATKKLLNIVELSEPGHLPFIQRLGWSFPLLYIKSFGRKTAELIQSLTISESRSALICCRDDRINSVNRVSFLIDLDMAVSLCERLDALPSNESNLIKKVVRELASGKMPRDKAQALLQGHDSLLSLMRDMPVDPYQRASVFSLLASIEKARVDASKKGKKNHNTEESA